MPNTIAETNVLPGIFAPRPKETCPPKLYAKEDQLISQKLVKRAKCLRNK